MAHNIVIYQDEGVGEFGLSCLLGFFKDDNVRLCLSSDVIDGSIFKQCDLFIMPGGADLPFCKKLNGTGNRNIRDYVSHGGHYLGLCAGAYYGCNAIEFHKGRRDEISGPRELSFGNVMAYGSLPDLAPYYDLSVFSAACPSIIMADGRIVSSFYHGGPAFKINGSNDIRVIARYEDVQGRPPAIISCRMGQGMAVLSGVHLEMSAEQLPRFPVKNPGDEERLASLIHRLQQNPLKPHDVLREILDQEYAL